MIHFFKRHTLLLIYLLVFLLLLYGVMVVSGTKYLGGMMLYLASLFVFYFIFQKLKLAERFTFLNHFKVVNEKLAIRILLTTIITFILIHLIYLGGSPALQALKLNTIFDVAWHRYSITADDPVLIGYGAAILLKAVLPFTLLYLLLKDNKTWYWILLVIAVFYSFSLMQKSYIVVVLAPVLIYSVLRWKYFYALKLIGIIMVVVIGLVYIANPVKEVTNKEVVSIYQKELDSVSLEFNEFIEIEEKPSSTMVTKGLLNRVLIVPGEMVVGWFENIPSRLPFLYGSGYSFTAFMTGKPFREYALELYPILKPQFARQGYIGSVNVASFMYDYANFGYAGLVLAGFILSLVFVFVEYFFRQDFQMKICLNLVPLLLLSSGALTTIMFSGGWGFLILLYFLFLRQNK